MSIAQRLSAYRKSLADRKSISMREDFEERYNHENAFIDKFLEQRDVPGWFRGISSFQLNAANNLLNALRDDTEQHTTHRVRQCLISIGLDPMINSSDTKLLMQLSRGNDLAFLWFLMELHYKTPGDIEYSVNEQLIMSSMCHLDMVTTLRELDRILPPRQPTKRELARRKRLQEEAQRANKRRKTEKPEYILPYFETQVRPVKYGKSLTVPMPDFRVKLDLYASYLNPNYIVPNEFNRWYATYKLEPERRIAKRIINDELTNIFEDYSHAAQKADNLETLCEHHKFFKELEKSLENELKVIAKERCMQMFDVTSARKEEMRQRIMDQLDNDVNLYMSKFRKLASKARKSGIVHRFDSETGIILLDDTRMGDRCAVLLPDGCTLRDEKIPSSDGSCCTPPEKCSKHATSVPDYARYIGPGDDQRESIPIGDGPTSRRSSKAVSIANASVTGRLRGSGIQKRSSYKEGENYICDIEQAEISSPRASQTYFHAAAEDMPYHFDYPKIFRFKDSSEEEEANIKKMFVEYLDSETALEEKRRDDGMPPDVDAAVDNCAKKIWKEAVKQKTIEMIKEEEERERQAQIDSENKTPLGYKQQYYDPEDRHLMHKMLREALCYMKKNPKFVLASFPDVDKLPLLREWIYHRYGKVYTKEERYRSFGLSVKIFRALDQLTLDVPMPNIKDLGTNLFVDYSCRDYLLRKAEHIKKQYYKRLDTAIMDQARIFWFAMRPYLCSNGPPRNTFFAYTPARTMDITHFRIWKPSEYMNAKGEWERRRVRDQREGFL